MVLAICVFRVVETKHPLQQGLRRGLREFQLLHFAEVETKHPLQQGLRHNIRVYTLECDVSRNQTSTTTRIATCILPFSLNMEV